MSRILYIDHYSGSTRHGMEFRPYYMAREWQKLGHEVTVVAASFSHLRHTNPVVNEGWVSEMVEGVRYIWLSTPAYAGNGLGRVRNILWFVARLHLAVPRLLREFRPDTVIASSTYPFDIFPARRIARRAGARLIFELHDLWPKSPMELGNMSRWHPFIMAAQWAEDYVCRHSDYIVSLLPKAQEHLVSRGMEPGKFVYVPNGIVYEDWVRDSAQSMPAEHAGVFAELRRSDNFVMTYAGAHGLLNNLGLLLEAAALLRGEAVRLVLVGQGQEKAALEQRAADLGLDNVRFLSPVKKGEIPAVLAASDALFLSFAPQPLFQYGVSPNKLMDYMMAGKPIIAAMRAGNNPVEEHGCGYTVAPDDPAALAKAIMRMKKSQAVDRAAMGARGRQSVKEHYAYEVLARRFSNYFPARPAS